MQGCKGKSAGCGIGFFFICLSALLFMAPVHAAELDPDWEPDLSRHPDILWIARADALVGISLATGEVRNSRTDIRPLQLVTHPADGNLWVLEEDSLHLLDANAEQLLKSVPLPFDGNAVIDFNVSGVNNSAWFLLDDTLWHADATGQFDTPVTLASTARALAVDLTSGKACVLHVDRIDCRDATLAMTATLPTPFAADVMSMNTTGEHLWLANDNQVARMDRNGNVTISPRNHGVKQARHLATDHQGGAWLADNHDVVYLDSNGIVSPAMAPFPPVGKGKGNSNASRIRSLLPDAVTSATWVLNNKQYRYLDAAGSLGPATDAPTGNSAIRTAALHRDITPPTIDLLAPEPEIYTNDPRELIKSSYVDYGSMVATDSLFLGLNGDFLPATCDLGEFIAHCHPVDDMPDGYHVLSARVSDLAGNWSEDALLQFTVDTIPPTITIDSPDDQLLTNQPEVLLEGRLSEWATLEVNRTEITIDNEYAFATSELMTEGQNDFLFHAVDRATNESKQNRTVYLDTVPPVITIDSHEDGEFTAERRHSIHGHVSEPITLILQGEEIPVSEESLEFSLTRELKPGDNLFSFQAIDLAGNTSSTNLQLTYLNQPPASLDPVLVSMDFDNAGNAIYFGAPGSLSPGSRLVLEPVYDENGNEVLSLPINIYPEDDGSFRFTLLPDINYQVYVEDALGRRSDPMLISDLANAPKQGKLVGALRGELSVDPNGTANYRIPITVPNGAGGMQPELALLYSSAAGNGQFGMGWSLSGLSAITRCPQTLHNDGAVRQVMHDSGDRLCLDGQRLLPHNDWSGSYLAPGRRFITERASFQRIRSHGGDKNTGPAGFTVEDKAGLIRHYGNYGDGPDGRIETDGTDTAMLWMINSIRDRHGNHIDFRYGYTRGEYWPREINWYNADGVRVGKIAFDSEIRPDKRLGALTDRTRRPMTRRITGITTYTRTDSGISPVRRININYEQGTFTKRSRIRSLELCGREGSGWKCVPETQFAWRDRSNPGSYSRIWGEKNGTNAYSDRSVH